MFRNDVGVGGLRRSGVGKNVPLLNLYVNLITSVILELQKPCKSPLSINPANYDYLMW